MADLFATWCPECGSDLPIEPRRPRVCDGCGRMYVNWFGNLIPDQSADVAQLPAA
ncbi:hypothetical protein BH10ACT2_BH10ACT2_28720 [soil metagenome]